MIVRRAFVAAALLAALPRAVSAAGAVDVRFVVPERFHDEDFRNSGKREQLMREFERHFQSLARRYLRNGQTLRVDILDVDLAGRYEPWRTRLSDVRIMRDMTPPRVKLRYRLEEGGRVRASAEETVSDLDYLSNPSARNSSQWLPYEKAMLTEWFRKRFGDLVPRG